MGRGHGTPTERREMIRASLFMIIAISALPAAAQMTPEGQSINDNQSNSAPLTMRSSITHDPATGIRLFDDQGRPVKNLDLEKYRADMRAKIKPSPDRGIKKHPYPSRQFIYGTYYNDIRTADEKAYLDSNGFCAVWIDLGVKNGSDLSCYQVREDLKTRPSNINIKRSQATDWPALRKRFECGEVSRDIVEQTKYGRAPASVFSEPELQDLHKRYEATLFFSNPANKLDPFATAHPFECAAWY